MRNKIEYRYPDNDAPKVGYGRIGLGLGLLILLVISGFLGGAVLGEGEPKVKVLAVRVVPFADEVTGRSVGMVMVDWQNVGNKAAYAVSADLTAYDAAGKVVDNHTTVIYIDDKGIPAGQSYHEADDDGYVIVPVWGTAKAVRATATITKVNGKFIAQ